MAFLLILLVLISLALSAGLTALLWRLNRPSANPADDSEAPNSGI